MKKVQASSKISEKVHIEYMSLEKLKRWPRNAKDHDLGEIHQSFSRFGYVAPILIDERSKKIVAGHGRLDSLLSMKDDGQKPPGRIVSKNGSWLVPVIRGIRFSSDREAEGYLLADNRLTEVGGWHEDILAEVLSEFAKEDKLDGLGWDADDVDEIIKGIQVEPREAPEAQIDKADELQKKWKVKLGQAWGIGNHKLMCGDSTKAEDVARVMGGEKADMVLNDPPYGMRLDTDYSKIKPTSDKHAKFEKAKGKTTNKNYTSVIGDDIDYDPNPVMSMFTNVKEQFWFGADYYAEKLPHKNDGSWLVWDKRQNEGDEYDLDEMFGASFELCWSMTKHKRQIIRARFAGLFGTETQDTKKRLHPAQKAIEVPIWIIDKYSESNNIIVDCYLGSGTTMVAAEQTGRVCFGMEIEPKYCAVTLERMSDMGLKPKLMS